MAHRKKKQSAGKLERRRQITQLNVLRRLKKHCKIHPKDWVGKKALERRT